MVKWSTHWSIIFVRIILPLSLLSNLGCCLWSSCIFRSCLSSVNECLDFSVVSLRLDDDQISPVDTADPPNQIDCCEKLQEADSQLCLITTLAFSPFSQACCYHCSWAWNHYIQDEADVCIDILNYRHICAEFPHTSVGLVDLKSRTQLCLGSILDAVLYVVGTFSRSFIISFITRTLWHGRLRS